MEFFQNPATITATLGVAPGDHSAIPTDSGESAGRGLDVLHLLKSILSSTNHLADHCKLHSKTTYIVKNIKLCT